MKQMKGLWKATLLIAGAALVTIALWLLGTLLFLAVSYTRLADAFLPVGTVSDALTETADGYRFAQGEALDASGAWAMLINPEGTVIWQYAMPDDVPIQYSLNDVAVFAKWYLHDYPVQCRTRDDGLLVLGEAKHSKWKYNFIMDSDQLNATALWTAVMLVLSLLCVIGLSTLLLRHWFQKEQKARDVARADWINGVSHDIRTPLSLVMGYAYRLAQCESLPGESRKQADIILHQSQLIKTLVGDLNLTMRLNYAMQPLRREATNPVALVRQAAADLVNAGLEERYTLHLDLPPHDGKTLLADGTLLSRALKNLLDNCVRHNEDGCMIWLKLQTDEKGWVFVVESEGAKPVVSASPNEAPELGESVHGTGLKLVQQIAAAHGGTAAFNVCGNRFCCRLHIPNMK